ncbi:hypothetical protein Ancab_025137 [Ancistrocladus abbreviatus]
MGPIAPALTARIPPDPSAKGVWSRAAPGGGKCALTSQRGRRVGNEAGRRGNGPDRNGTNGPDPTRPLGQGCLVESGTGVGDPEGSALVGPLMIIPRPPQRLFARAAEGERRVKNDVKGGGVGAIIPALMHRIPSELRS